MTLTLLNVIYVLLAIAMIGFILVQRGAGAQAGSGFGGGASATVFGSRGAGNFLTKATKYLAIVFFGLSLGMAMYVSHGGIARLPTEDLGVMDADVPASATPAPAPASDVPAAPAATLAPAAGNDVPAAAPPAAAAPAAGDVPPAPAPAPAASATPAPAAAPEEPAKQ